jgi:rubrerythrin
MKRLLGLLMGAMLLMAVHAAWADDSTGNTGVSTPAMSSIPVAKHKVKKAKKKTSAITAAPLTKTYVCPMDGYTSDKPGKCPSCGMDLVEKKPGSPY